MTTDKPTCPFCLREMKEMEQDWEIAVNPLFYCTCEIGENIGAANFDRTVDLEVAVMEMQKRDYAAGLQRSAGPLNYSDWLNDNFNNYIDRLKAEAKEVK